MGCRQHTGRCFLLTICVLQIISTAERQVFDFLGYMWLPIIANFFNFILVIFGFFGAYQYKTKYLLMYLAWELAWLAWNAFIICFFLNAGVLENTRDWLNFGTGSASWWEVNGVGCRAVYPTNLTALDPLRPMRPLEVHGCLVDYEYVEAIHAGVQCGFAVLGVCASTYLVRVFSEQDDTCTAKRHSASIYSVEYSSPQRDGSESPELGLEDSTCQPPMTPRRVKRQSRHRASGRSQTRSSSGNNNNNPTRSSQRSRRHQYLNPVTRLMDRANESSTSTDSPRPHTGVRQGHSNPMYVHSRPGSSYSVGSPPPGHQDPPERPPSVHSSYSNYHGQRPSLNPHPFHRPATTGLAGAPHQRGTLGSLRSSTLKLEREERPPPYMFGVNSETVI